MVCVHGASGLGDTHRFVPHAQVREHGDGLVGLVGALVHAGGVVVLALVRQDLRQELLVVRVALLARRLDGVDEVDVPHVAHTDEGLAGHVELHGLECGHGEQAPVAVRDAQAGHLVRHLPVADADVAVQRRGLRHVDGLHGDVVQAEDLGAVEADHEALHLLLVHREVAGLDAEHTVAAETQHILHLCVPRHAVGIGLHEQALLCRQVVHLAVRLLIHHRQLVARRRQVQAADGGGLADEVDGERVVHENLQDDARLQADQQALTPRRASHHLDVADDALQHPLPLLGAVEIVELQLALLAQDDVQRRDDEQVALQLLVDALAHAVAHVAAVLVHELVDDDNLR